MFDNFEDCHKRLFFHSYKIVAIRQFSQQLFLQCSVGRKCLYEHKKILKIQKKNNFMDDYRIEILTYTKKLSEVLNYVNLKKYICCTNG